MPVPDQIDVYFDESMSPITCRSIEHVDAVLDNLHQTAIAKKISLSVAIKVFGHEIDTGLGRDLTYLSLQIDPCDGEYYLAIGNQSGDEIQMFYGAGQDSYWPAKNLIPLETAREAVHYFIEHQKRCPLIRWQDWNGQEV